MYAQVCLALSLTNSGVNVLIYSWRYATFRRALVSMLTGVHKWQVRGDNSYLAGHDGYRDKKMMKMKTVTSSPVFFNTVAQPVT
jgi:hypothetical protein